MIEHAIRDFFFLWATIDPVGTLVIFAALTKKMSPERQKQVAKRATIYATCVLVGAIVLGLDGYGDPYLVFSGRGRGYSVSVCVADDLC